LEIFDATNNHHRRCSFYQNPVKDHGLIIPKAGLSADSQFFRAIGAAHALSLAAMRWHGYRSDSRYLVFYFNVWNKLWGWKRLNGECWISVINSAILQNMRAIWK
jgi:hypothetical protein